MANFEIQENPRAGHEMHKSLHAKPPMRHLSATHGCQGERSLSPH